MNNFYVYKYLRSEDSINGLKGSPYYIGKGRNYRAYQKHRVKLPIDRNDIIIVENNLTNAEAIALEVKLIKEYGRIDNSTGCLANLTDGGEGNSGWICRDSTRQKIGKANKGRQRSEDSKINQSKLMSGKNNPFYGKTHSEKTSKKMSETRKGLAKQKPFSKEHRENMSKAFMERVPWNKGRKGVQDYSRIKKDEKGRFVKDLL